MGLQIFIHRLHGFHRFRLIKSEYSSELSVKSADLWILSPGVEGQTGMSVLLAAQEFVGDGVGAEDFAQDFNHAAGVH